MIYRTTYPISHYGDRIEKGTEIELTDAEALNYADAVELIDDQPEVASAPEVEVPLAEMNSKQLKEKAKALGLAATGSNADLVERITLYIASAPEGDITNQPA